MTKGQLVTKLAMTTGITKEDAQKALNGIIEIIFYYCSGNKLSKLRLVP